jgi:MoaA/NifB/PqqE/SkfB family radical SAM enzyme
MLRALSGGGPDPLFPVSVELSLTHRCNLSCLYCSDQGVRLGADRLGPIQLSSLFSDLARGGTRGVTIEGGGEPTLSAHFGKALSLASREGLSLGLITNGLQPFPRGLDPGLYRLFQWVRVSLDSYDEDSFLALKGRRGFGDTMANIEALARLRPGGTLGVGHVLTRLNCDPRKLLSLAMRLRGLGVSYLSVRPVVDHPGLEADPGLLDPDGPLSAVRAAEDRGFRVDLAPLRDNAPAGNLSLPCVAHPLSAVVGADGRVWLCGRLNADPAFPPMGDLLSSGFRAIWEGPRRAAQAKDALSPAFCRAKCPRCRMTKYNRLISQAGCLRTPDFI